MNPEDLDAIFDRANRLLEAGKPDESLECLDKVDGRTLDSDDRIEWGSLRAWALSQIGQHEEALELLDELLEEFPQSVRLLGAFGIVLSNNDELEDARDALEEAVALGPTDEVALANLALVYEKLREYERSLELYDRALELGADIDWVLLRKAATLTECGRYAEAKVTLKRYLSLVPEDAGQWIALAILHSDDEEYADAFRCYEQAEQLDPDAPALRLNWGVTAVRAHQLPAAYKQLARLRRLEPRSARAGLLRAFILEEEGDLAGARGIYDRTLARARYVDRGELSYAFEMAMDFFGRQKLRTRCERLLGRAYEANACTVELCEAYREATGEYVAQAFWYSLVIEADYRLGLLELRARNGSSRPPPTRFTRNYQVVARNHDDTVDMVVSLLQRMGETNPNVREFIGQEPIEQTHVGLYEVEPEGFVFSPDELEEPPSEV